MLNYQYSLDLFHYFLFLLFKAFKPYVSLVPIVLSSKRDPNAIIQCRLLNLIYFISTSLIKS